MKTRSLSQQGKELFTSGLALTSQGSSPRSHRIKAPWLNSFAALNAESDEEDDMDEVVSEDHTSNNGGITPQTFPSKVGSPRINASPRGEHFASPPWEVQITRRPPKLRLTEADVNSKEPAQATVVHVLSSNQTGLTIDEDEADLSVLSSITTDTKGRRDTRRSQHGSKANRFKAMKQRLDSMAKRDEQRESAKRGGKANDYDGGDWDDEDD
jgi:hypothetical protein